MKSDFSNCPSLDAGLVAYYERRAAEYERIYEKPERQADLLELHGWVARNLAGRRVLEIACGTGYWTERIAPAAAFVLATDGAREPLQVALRKRWTEGRVQFGVLDAFRLDAVQSLEGMARTVTSHGPFDAVFAGFWWSHVPLSGLSAFLENVRRSVTPGSCVAFVDNRYVEGSSTPVARRDAEGNTYQLRRLEDGSSHEVLKNFPDEAALARAAATLGNVVELRLLKYFWCLRCST